MIVDSKDPTEKVIDVTLGTEVIVSMTVRELRAIIRALSLTVRAGTKEAESCARIAGSILLAREQKLLEMQDGNERLVEIVSNICPHSNTVVDGVCTVCLTDVPPIQESPRQWAKHDESCCCSSCHKANR